MKNYIIYAGILLVGLTAGWLIFGNSAKAEDKEVKSEEIWTCSMHPQIKLPEPGDCPLCGMDLIPLETGGNENPLVFEMSEEAVRFQISKLPLLVRAMLS